VQGTRLPDNEWLSRAADGEIKPGDYGRCDAGWFVCCPDGSTTRLWVDEDDRNGNRHILTEYDDGSITVGGSIMGGQVVPVVALIGEVKSPGEFWHGYLERGVWRSV
jgi:hypothetical protein